MSTETIITGVPAAEPSAGDASFWKSNLRDYGLLVSLLLIMAFFEVVTGGVLFRGVNVTNLILQNSYIVIMALGMLLVIVGGNIDLSVGSIVGFVGGCAAIMMVGFHVPWARHRRQASLATGYPAVADPGRRSLARARAISSPTARSRRSS